MCLSILNNVAQAKQHQFSNLDFENSRIREKDWFYLYSHLLRKTCLCSIFFWMKGILILFFSELVGGHLVACIKRNFIKTLFFTVSKINLKNINSIKTFYIKYPFNYNQFLPFINVATRVWSWVLSWVLSCLVASEHFQVLLKMFRGLWTCFGGLWPPKPEYWQLLAEPRRGE